MAPPYTVHEQCNPKSINLILPGALFVYDKLQIKKLSSHLKNIQISFILATQV